MTNSTSFLLSLYSFLFSSSSSFIICVIFLRSVLKVENRWPILWIELTSIDLNFGDAQKKLFSSPNCEMSIDVVDTLSDKLSARDKRILYEWQILTFFLRQNEWYQILFCDGRFTLYIYFGYFRWHRQKKIRTSVLLKGSCVMSFILVLDIIRRFLAFNLLKWLPTRMR